MPRRAAYRAQYQYKVRTVHGSKYGSKYGLTVKSEVLLFGQIKRAIPCQRADQIRKPRGALRVELLEELLTLVFSLGEPAEWL
jgi:hypothetical protein